jgi:hypothetical protein
MSFCIAIPEENIAMTKRSWAIVIVAAVVITHLHTAARDDHRAGAIDH